MNGQRLCASLVVPMQLRHTNQVCMKKFGALMFSSDSGTTVEVLSCSGNPRRRGHTSHRICTCKIFTAPKGMSYDLCTHFSTGHNLVQDVFSQSACALSRLYFRKKRLVSGRNWGGYDLTNRLWDSSVVNQPRPKRNARQKKPLGRKRLKRISRASRRAPRQFHRRMSPPSCTASRNRSSLRKASLKSN